MLRVMLEPRECCQLQVVNGHSCVIALRGGSNRVQFSVVLSWDPLISKLRCSARGGVQKSFARNTVRPVNSRAAPAGACPQAWGKKEKRESERERERERGRGERGVERLNHFSHAKPCKPPTRRAAPAGACPQAWGKKEGESEGSKSFHGSVGDNVRLLTLAKEGRQSKRGEICPFVCFSLSFESLTSPRVQAELAPCEVPKPGSACFKVIKPLGRSLAALSDRFFCLSEFIARG